MNIALVAHDSRKKEMIEWVEYNYETLLKHKLFATGTTGKLIEEILINVTQYDKSVDVEYTYSIEPFKDNITKLLSGPLGGDGQISSMIAEGKIDVLIFFCDNLIMQGHQNDVSALTRLASLYNIAFATNRTTADMILTSRLFDSTSYTRIVPECIEKYKNRQI